MLFNKATMLVTSSFVCSLVCSVFAAPFSDVLEARTGPACQQIAAAISGTVYYPPLLGLLDLTGHFTPDISHYMTSSSQTPQCVVEVANPQDVFTVLKIVGSTRTPFAVKSGEHASNPGFSSTTSVFISLVRMKQVNLSTDLSTVEIGLGNIWNDGILALVTDLQPRSMQSLTDALPTQIQAGQRGAFSSVSTIKLTPTFMEAVHNESLYWGTLALLHTGVFISYDLEPLMNFGQYAIDSAFQHDASQMPVNIYFSWLLAADDAFWRANMQKSVDQLTAVAKAEGIYYNITYPNYALSTATGTQLYGATNVARLAAIQARVDPTGVMELAGGWTFN